MRVRTALTTLSVAAVVAAVVQVGCGSETSPPSMASPPTPRAGPESRAVDAGRLSELARLLARRHEVVVLRGSRLPRREPDVPPAKAAELPALLKPVAGLRVKLPGRRTLFVYRYASPDIAAAPAPAFLRSSVVDEVSGCGAQIWFAKSPTASPTSAASASRAVGVALRRGLRPCGKAFLVVT